MCRSTHQTRTMDMAKPVERRCALTGIGILAASLLLALTAFGQAQGPARAKEGGKAKPPAADGTVYKFVNKTGKFTDEQCFWSLNGGRDWHSFAKEPTVPCSGNGRVYFRLG